MTPALVVIAYLAIVLCIGIFAFRVSRRKNDAEDYFLAGRSLGPTVFLLSLFGTNMTAFSILGASGHAFANGIVTFGLMASSSALIIPVGIFVTYFRPTVVLYPICMLFIWLPSVFLGVVASQAKALPAIEAKLEARAQLATPDATLPPDTRARLRAQASGDDVILRLVDGYAPLWLASLLGAAVMAAVMASDSQILALSTMFNEDVFTFYQGSARFGQAVQVLTGRVFVILVTIVAYLVALRLPQSIFDVATQYAFAGYAALAPLLVAALFWKNSTRWGALASTLWTAATVVAVAVCQTLIPAPPPGSEVVVWSLNDVRVITRGAAGTLVLGLLPVVPMTIISGLLMIAVSLATLSASKPGAVTLARYFR
jgi:Na+/proline symporter